MPQCSTTQPTAANSVSVLCRQKLGRLPEAAIIGTALIRSPRALLVKKNATANIPTPGVTGVDAAVVATALAAATAAAVWVLRIKPRAVGQTFGADEWLKTVYGVLSPKDHFNARLIGEARLDPVTEVNTDAFPTCVCRDIPTIYTRGH